MKKYLSVLSLVLVLSSYGQNISLISPDDIPGIQIVRSDSFSGQTLNKYAGTKDGLCYEYGFIKLYLTEYSFHDDRVKSEVFLMEDGPSAFGIYSVSINNCFRWNLYSTFSCLNPNQLSAAYGNFFINNINLSKTGSGQTLCEQIVQLMMTKNPKESWNIPLIFQHPKLTSFINTLKYIEGPNGIATGAPQLTELLENLQFNCYTINIATPTYAGILARIIFPDFNSMSSFVIQAGLNTSGGITPTMAMNGFYRSWYKIEDTKLIYLECSSPDLKLTDLIPEKPTPMY